ncbi:MAG: hypothetical protein BGO49_03575 [Planctomycetales bacterium 71-10]|nr:MAG: hypothetical protein BGO49_03575 [Planctomycetales bacterium 71-10]
MSLLSRIEDRFLPSPANRLLLGACLLVGSPRVHAADPDVAAPRPSAGAVRLVGGEEVAFTPAASPVAGLRQERKLGAGDFAVGLSFRSDETATRDLGDLMSLWDPQTRHGFTLGLRNNAGCTTSQPNWRQLQFGVDAGTTPEWRDEGRPGDALLGFSIAVHEGRLYVGTCEPKLPHVGRVYRYDGPGRWTPLGPLDGSNAVTAMATLDGRLYAATGKYKVAGSSLPESDNPERGGRVYRLVDSDRWELVGDLDPCGAIAGLVNYGGRLYASSLYAPAGFFRYEGGREWTSIPTPEAKRVQSLGVHGGALYATSYDGGSVYRYDGKSWEDLGPVAADITQNYSFTTYQDSLHVSTWPAGKVYRLGADDRWVDAGRLGAELEVMAMLVHNGSFYAGSLPRGEVFRYEGGERWTPLKQLDETPDVRYRRVWAMATHQGRLFATTLPSGKVWSMSAGGLATYDRELAPGWHDVAARRTAGKLHLFVDGRAVAEADGAGLDLETAGLELKLGDGPRGRFVGAIKDAWFDAAP